MDYKHDSFAHFLDKQRRRVRKRLREQAEKRVEETREWAAWVPRDRYAVLLKADIERRG